VFVEFLKLVEFMSLVEFSTASSSSKATNLVSIVSSFGIDDYCQSLGL